MNDEWPDIVIDEDDVILNEEILLSGAEVDEAEREAYAAMAAAAQTASRAMGNLVVALQRFGDAMRVIHDDVMLSQTELTSE